MPIRRYRRIKKKKIATGTTSTTPAANICVHSMPVAPIAAEIFTGRGLAVVVAKMDAKENSFHAKMKQKPAVAAIPDVPLAARASGRH